MVLDIDTGQVVTRNAANGSYGCRGDLAEVAKLEDEEAKLDKVYPLTFYDGALTSADATAIELQAGASVTADITLRAVPAVHLRLPNESSLNLRRYRAAKMLLRRKSQWGRRASNASNCSRAFSTP